MKRITYNAGQFSQVKLGDGSRIFFETLPEAIRLKKIFLGIVPTTTIWEYRFPFYIRTVNEPWELAKEILDLVLESIEGCTTLKEIKERLNNTFLLDFYVQENELRAYDIGVEKLGTFAVKKYLERSQSLRDAISIPHEMMEIIGDYGKVLEEVRTSQDKYFLCPLSKLPHAKEKIREALTVALKIAKDEKIRESLIVALTELDNFLPDEEISIIGKLVDEINTKAKRISNYFADALNAYVLSGRGEFAKFMLIEFMRATDGIEQKEKRILFLDKIISDLTKNYPQKSYSEFIVTRLLALKKDIENMFEGFAEKVTIHINEKEINIMTDPKLRPLIEAIINFPSEETPTGLNELTTEEMVKAIENFSDEEILNLAMERPGHKGQFGFMLNHRVFKSIEQFSEIMSSLHNRLTKAMERAEDN